MESWITILAVILVFFFSIYLLYHYAFRKTPPLVYAAVFVSYFITFSILAILPYDVGLALGEGGSKPLMLTSWKILYWTIFTLCWFVLPLMKNYMLAGEFTFWRKLRRGVYVHLRSTLIMAGLGVIFIIYLFIVQKLKP